jgi:hypothetical protein
MKPVPNHNHRMRRNLFVVVVLTLWGLITHAGFAGSGDEPHYMMIAYSLAFDRDMDVTHDYEHVDNLVFGENFEAGAHARPGKDGRLRPVHDVGMPLLFAPYYAVAYGLTTEIVKYVPESWLRRARLNFRVIQRHFLSAAMIGITGAMAVALLELFSALSFSERRAFAWTALLVLSPPILSHSFLFFTEILSALIALRIVLWFRGSPSTQTGALFAGAAVGYLLLIHARNVGLIAGLVAVVVNRSRRWQNGVTLLVWFSLGAILLLLVRTGVTYHFWGTLVTTPHARFGDTGGWRPALTEGLIRLAGWLFDQEHGLLPYAPIYLLLPVGWIGLWKRDRELCLELSIIVAIYIGTMTVPTLNAAGWRGGWTPAARFLVPVIPFLCVFVFGAVAQLPRISAPLLVIVALQIGFDMVLWQHPGLFWNDGTGTSALLHYLDGGTGRLSLYLPSLLSPVTTKKAGVVGITALLWLAITASLIASLHIDQPESSVHD